jgi:hypothetical protein
MERKAYSDNGNNGGPPEKRKRGRPPGQPNPNGGRRKGHWAVAKGVANGVVTEQYALVLAANAKQLAHAVLMEEGRIAFSDVRLIPGCPEGIPDEIAYAISSFQVEEEVLKTLEGDEQILRRRTKFTLWPKGQALERLSRHLGLYEQDNKQKATPERPQLNLYLEQGDANIVTTPALPMVDRANGHSRS